MTSEGQVEMKKRGRPAGSKNKMKIVKTRTGPKEIKLKTPFSVEATIRHLLELPMSAETKIKLIKAALD